MKRMLKRFISLIICVILLTGCLGIPAFGTAPDMQLENVAKGKVPIVSNEYSDAVWNKSYLTDGSCMGSWPLPEGETLGWRTEAMPGRETEVTLQFDLGGMCVLSEIILYPRGNGGICFPDDYELSLSSDGENWKSIASVTGDTAVEEKKRSFTFPPEAARYFMLKVTKLSEDRDGQEYACELSEIEIMGVATRTNLARNAALSSDSEWKDPEGFWNLAYLIDGYVTDSWPLASGRTLGWRSGICDGRDTEINIILDLEDVQTFDEMALYPRGNGGICFPEDYSVLISDDGNDWECIYTKTGDSETSEKKRTLKFERVSARYVRLQITKLSEEKDGADFLCEISEIEIWGECETKMKLNKSNLQMSIGAEDKLIPEIKGESEQPDFIWTLSGDSVILGEGGRIRAVKEGISYVTCTDASSGTSSVCEIKVLPDKEDNILITVPMWGNNDLLNQEQFEMLREAEVDGIMAVGHDNSQSCTDKMLGIAQSIWDDDLNRNLGVFIHSYNQGITPSSSDEEIISYAEKWKNTPAFLGYHVEDEPFHVNPYARIIKLLRETDPFSTADVNFLPGMVYGNYGEFYGRLTDYAKLCGGETYLSFDNYPFTPAAGSVDESALFGNFEALRRAGLTCDVPTAFYVQGVGSEHYGYRRPDEGTLRYHIAAGLSYGFKWIKYYSWYVPGASGTGECEYYTDAIMSHNGEKTELYDIARTLNKQVHNVGNVLSQLDAVEVYHTGSKSKNSVYKRIPSNFFIQAEGDSDAIVTLFENPETGRQYLMLVNKDFTAPAVLRFELSGVSSVKELDKDNKGEYLTPEYKDGILTREFLPGEFALYELPQGQYGTEKQESENLLSDAGSTASGSKTENGWYIAYANDGVRFSENGKNGWMIETEDESDKWLTFDLGQPKKFDRLDLYPAGSGASCGSAYPTALKIFVSDDGESWNEIFSDDSINQPTTEVPVFRFEETEARFIKLEFPSCTITAIGEAELYNNGDNVPLPPETPYTEPVVIPGKNLAFGKPASASCAYNDAVWKAANVTDGVKMQSWPTSSTLGWHSGNFQSRDVADIWLKVNLEANYPIDRIVLYPRGNGGICFPSDYKIQISSDNKTWITVADVTGEETKGEQPHTYEFDTAYAKYVRLIVSRLGPDIDSGGYACEISEIEVYCDHPPVKPGEGDGTETEDPAAPSPTNPSTGNTEMPAVALLVPVMIACITIAIILRLRCKKLR